MLLLWLIARRIRSTLKLQPPTRSEWETDTEDEEQDEGLYTPAEKTTSKSSISPEDATAKQQAAEKRKLFVEGK